MSGALAERVFATKLDNVGFAGVTVHDRQPFGLADASRLPMFTPDLIELMRDLLTSRQQDEVAVSVTLTAVKPETRDR